MFVKVPRILLVEDDAVVQKAYEYFLECCGCSVAVLNDGRLVLDERLDDYDLILMDVGLPGTSGLVVSSLIRGDIKNTKIPIIALISSETGRSYEDYGINDVLIKPVIFDDLKEKLVKWLPDLVKIN